MENEMMYLGFELVVESSDPDTCEYSEAEKVSRYFEVQRPVYFKDGWFYPYEWRIALGKKGRKPKETK